MAKPTCGRGLAGLDLALPHLHSLPEFMKWLRHGAPIPLIAAHAASSLVHDCQIFQDALDPSFSDSEGKIWDVSHRSTTRRCHKDLLSLLDDRPREKPTTPGEFVAGIGGELAGK